MGGGWLEGDVLGGYFVEEVAWFVVLLLLLRRWIGIFLAGRDGNGRWDL